MNNSFENQSPAMHDVGGGGEIDGGDKVTVEQYFNGNYVAYDC